MIEEYRTLHRSFIEILNSESYTCIIASLTNRSLIYGIVNIIWVVSVAVFSFCVMDGWKKEKKMQSAIPFFSLFLFVIYMCMFHSAV